MRGSRELNIGGLTALSTIDYPGGMLSAVVFCQGCPWRCRYCHNPELQPARGASGPSWAEVEALLGRRRGLLDAVVFSGGEPILQPSLEDAIARARRLGFRIGLHTAGIHPQRLSALLPRLDWVGLDVKALPGDYPRITRIAGSGERAWESVRRVIGSGVPHDMRITVHPVLTDRAQARQIAGRLRAMGARRVTEQHCRGDLELDDLPVTTPPAGRPNRRAREPTQVT